MIRGTDVTVRSFEQGGVDRLGNPIMEASEQAVGNVLVQPGATMDMEASRPEGAVVAFTLHFPKTWTGPLEGCEIDLPQPWGGTYRVIGSPAPYMDENTPTPWHMAVEVEAAHG